MATNPRKRQQKLERRAAKRKEKKHDLVRGQVTGLTDRLTAAAARPVLHAWITENLWEQGMGWALLSRELPGGSVAVVVFLVDRYCLGVKDALADFVGRFAYDTKYVRKMQTTFESRTVSPATVRKLVEEAVAYAQELGIPPHPDFHKAKLLFGDVNASESTEPFEFGKDGKPFFIAGPSDTPQRCRQIMNTLQRHCGPGQFHYQIPISGSDLIGLSGDDEDPSLLEYEDEDED